LCTAAAMFISCCCAAAPGGAPEDAGVGATAAAMAARILGESAGRTAEPGGKTSTVLQTSPCGGIDTPELSICCMPVTGLTCVTGEAGLLAGLTGPDTLAGELDPAPAVQAAELADGTFCGESAAPWLMGFWGSANRCSEAVGPCESSAP